MLVAENPSEWSHDHGGRHFRSPAGQGHDRATWVIFRMLVASACPVCVPDLQFVSCPSLRWSSSSQNRSSKQLSRFRPWLVGVPYACHGHRRGFRTGTDHAGMRATLYSLKRLSRVTIVSPSASA
jgi:hypothetical protein